MLKLTKENYKQVSENENILGLIMWHLDNGDTLVATDDQAIGEYVCSSDFGMVQIKA